MVSKRTNLDLSDKATIDALAARDAHIEANRQRWLPAAGRISAAVNAHAYGLELTIKMGGITAYFHLTDTANANYAQSYCAFTHSEAEVIHSIGCIINNQKRQLIDSCDTPIPLP